MPWRARPQHCDAELALQIGEQHERLSRCAVEICRWLVGDEKTRFRRAEPGRSLRSDRDPLLVLVDGDQSLTRLETRIQVLAHYETAPQAYPPQLVDVPGGVPR